MTEIHVFSPEKQLKAQHNRANTQLKELSKGVIGVLETSEKELHDLIRDLDM